MTSKEGKWPIIFKKDEVLIIKCDGNCSPEEVVVAPKPLLGTMCA